MQTRFIRHLSLAFLGTFLATGAAHAAITLYDKDDWKVMMGGFVEMDMFSDSTRSLTEVVGSNPIARHGSFDGDNGRTQFSMRNTRLSFGILPPIESDWKTKAYFEFDFLGYDPNPSVGGTSESGYQTNPTLRMRHAYLSAEKNGLLVVAGQTWTLFGWVPTYVPTNASVPPVTGTVYERTPQVAAIQTIAMGENSLQAGLSIDRPVQRDSNTPGVDAGLRYSISSRKAGYTSSNGDDSAQSMSVAISGTARDIVSQPAGGGTSGSVTHLASAFALNGMIPIIASSDGKDTGNTLALSGEFTKGRGYGDEFSGWSGNIAQTATPASNLDLDAGQGGFDTGGSFHLIELQTWNAQLQYHLPTEWHAFIDLGYGQLRSNNISSLVPAGGKVAYDRSEVYYANVFHDITAHIRVAAEFDHFTTRYVDGINSQDNRYQLSTWIRF
jgi:hypothetical protein